MEVRSMKYLRYALILLACASIGCDDNPNDPSDTPVTFTAALSSAQEVPPVANAEAGASGTATIRLNVTRDSSQTITAATVDFEVTMTGFPAGSAITIAHIHEAPAGQNGGIVVNTGLASGQVTLTNGAGSFTRNGVSAQADVAQRILDNPGNFYFNVHSELNPGGVIRAQLVRQ
jgi:hypothetical protein